MLCIGKDLKHTKAALKMKLFTERSSADCKKAELYYAFSDNC